MVRSKLRNIYFARTNECLLDLDNPVSVKQFRDRISKLDGLTRKIVILSTRPNHYHVYIQLKKHYRFPNLFALSTYLGSDTHRELSNYSRYIQGAKYPCLLIEYTKVRHGWRKPDIVCSCPRKYKGKKLSNCRHLIRARGHKSKFGYLSTRLETIGISNPYA